jgi:hypothetical protein
MKSRSIPARAPSIFPARTKPLTADNALARLIVTQQLETQNRNTAATLIKAQAPPKLDQDTTR